MLVHMLVTYAFQRQRSAGDAGLVSEGGARSTQSRERERDGEYLEEKASDALSAGQKKAAAIAGDASASASAQKGKASSTSMANVTSALAAAKRLSVHQKAGSSSGSGSGAGSTAAAAAAVAAVAAQGQDNPNYVGGSRQKNVSGNIFLASTGEEEATTLRPPEKETEPVKKVPAFMQAVPKKKR
jgi:hypothetical protein